MEWRLPREAEIARPGMFLYEGVNLEEDEGSEGERERGCEEFL